jgi:hypothetical protein
MLKTLLSTVIAASFVLPAFAGEARMSRPIEAGSLAEDGVSLVAYYVPLADDAYEVTATWLGADDAEAHRLVMRLAEGEDVTFALPGHPGLLYTFAREFDAVRISTEPAAETFRSASL